MIIKRDVSEKVLQYAGQFPIITITGPRQSGKTILSRELFAEKPYVSLEDIDERLFAQNDPRGFLGRFPDGAIIDEVQRAPDIISYIQTIVDNRKKDGMFILTGSQQFELMERISQSLAGRTALVRLLPFSLNEAYSSFRDLPSVDEVLYTGSFPRIFDKKLDPTEAMQFYVNTYIERDLRKLINIKDLSKFEIFLKLCAGRSGQILNYSSLGNDCGVNHNTVKSWLSVLEASYLIKLLQPYYRNYNKRLIKAPKLYFLDTGLACFLLNIVNQDQLSSHPLKGALFETFVMTEILKKRFNSGKTDHLYFFRDNSGNEVDLICDYGEEVKAIEIKSGQTVAEDFFKGLLYFAKLHGKELESHIIYGGNQTYKRNQVKVVGWKDLKDKIDF
ncbi:MAG: ATP-binding protein [Desulfobacteraceae bacterium]|nr:MAG: ATP-binding protein [Desulfobacteraceae bacterium]